MPDLIKMRGGRGDAIGEADYWMEMHAGEYPAHAAIADLIDYAKALEAALEKKRVVSVDVAITTELTGEASARREQAAQPTGFHAGHVPGVDK